MAEHLRHESCTSSDREEEGQHVFHENNGGGEEMKSRGAMVKGVEHMSRNLEVNI